MAESVQEAVEEEREEIHHQEIHHQEAPIQEAVEEVLVLVLVEDLEEEIDREEAHERTWFDPTLKPSIQNHKNTNMLWDFCWKPYHSRCLVVRGCRNR